MSKSIERLYFSSFNIHVVLDYVCCWKMYKQNLVHIMSSKSIFTVEINIKTRFSTPN